MQRVKLNIAMSYPVKWTVYGVMRDYIQNFYDAVGPELFGEKFVYNYENETLTMSADKGFCKDWLMYMGASSKRNNEKSFAGKYGEGFKIASLVALRDFGFQITMESRDWKMVVVQDEENIGEERFSVLAYDIEERRWMDGALLTLKGVSEENYQVFLEEIEKFFYKSNPRFGRCVVESKRYAIYQSKEGSAGCLYINYQERELFRLPVIICNHRYEVTGDDRDRVRVSREDVKRSIIEVVRQLSPQQAVEVLVLFERCWDGRLKTDVHFDVSEVIRELIYCICRDKKAREIFCARFMDKILGMWWQDGVRSKKKTAWNWYKRSQFCSKYRVVMCEFSLLGIEGILDLCKRNNGFQVYAKPNEMEKSYIKVLEKMARDVFGDLICYEQLPECEVITNENVPIDGLARLYPEKSRGMAGNGMMVKYSNRKVFLRKRLFEENKFGEAMSVYMHELLHQFGGDNSPYFCQALMKLNLRIAEEAEKLEEAEAEWKAVR